MLVTLADLKSYLGISSGNTSQDAFLTDQGTLISDTVELYCRRIFTATTYTQTWYSTDFDWASNFETFHFPIITVTSVVEDAVTLATSDYRIHKPTGKIIRVCGNFFTGDETVVTYQAGYATLPTPIGAVIKSLVAERYNKKISGVQLNFGSDVQRISIPGAISIDFDYSLSNNDRKTAFGTTLGSQVNVLDYFRSDRAILGSSKLVFI